MQFDFDAAKDEANRFKHRLSLAFGKRVFDDPFMTLSPTIRIGDEEERWKAIGLAHFMARRCGSNDFSEAE